MRLLEQNESKNDRIIRAILGVIIAGIGYYTGWWLLYILAAILLVTAATGFCLIYKIFNFSTLEK